MTTTPDIQKLVREGRATPYDAALLMELRDRVAAKERRSFRAHPFLSIAVVVGVFLLGMIGIQVQRQND